MAVVIPDDMLSALGMSEEQVRQEMAIMLFREDKLSLSKAARLAGMTRLTFQKLLASRMIPIHYDEADFRQDIQALQSGGLL